MSAGAVLMMKREHEELRHLMRALDGIAGAYHEARPVGVDDLQAAMDTAERYGQRCWEAQEQRAILPALKDCAPDQARRLHPAIAGQRRRERALMGIMRAQVDAAAQGEVRAQMEWAKAARAYAIAIRDHIGIEERVVLPTLESELPGKDRAAVARRMREVEEKVLGDDGEIVVRRIHDLESRYAHWIAV